MNLAHKKCVPCEVGGAPFSSEEIRARLTETPGWSVSLDEKRISKDFAFKDFSQALSFTNKIGELAEREGHHPDIHIHYNKVILELWTHAIEGLSENDFIMAAKINSIGQ